MVEFSFINLVVVYCTVLYGKCLLVTWILHIGLVVVGGVAKWQMCVCMLCGVGTLCLRLHIALSKSKVSSCSSPPFLFPVSLEFC